MLGASVGFRNELSLVACRGEFERGTFALPGRNRVCADNLGLAQVTCNLGYPMLVVGNAKFESRL